MENLKAFAPDDPKEGRKVNFSVVVPVYNSERTLKPLLERLRPVLEEYADRYEVILVNDGSRDKSWTLIRELTQRYPWVRGINLARNFGQHNALLCGVRLARYEMVVTLDDDLQHPPEEIPKLIGRLREGYDVVYGIPENGGHPYLRRLASNLNRRILARASHAREAGPVSAFRAFRTSLREAFAFFHSPHVSLHALLSGATTRFGYVSVVQEKRFAGSSHYSFSRLLDQAFSLHLGMATLPFKTVFLSGIFIVLAGVGTLLLLLGADVWAGRIRSWERLFMATVVFLGGMQWALLGLLGEILVRIHFQTVHQPPYIIAEDTGKTDDKAHEGPFPYTVPHR